MRTERSRRANWVALLAAWVLACLPALTQVLAHTRGETWIEVCTSQGMKRLAAQHLAGDDPSGTPAQASLMPCPFCLLGAGAAPLPSSPTARVETPARSRALKAPCSPAPLRASLWLHGQPRAPPVLT